MPRPPRRDSLPRDPGHSGSAAPAPALGAGAAPSPTPAGGGHGAAGLAGIATGIHREARDRELAAQGWTRRFVGGPPKLNEQVELYEALGREVLLDPVREGELAVACAGCALALSLFKVVYTRSVK